MTMVPMIKVAMRAHLRGANPNPAIGWVDPQAWTMAGSRADIAIPVVWEEGGSTMVMVQELQALGPGESVDGEQFPDQVAFQQTLDWVDRQRKLASKVGGFVVPGVGPDAPIETNENGASQSKTGFAATSLPPKALLAVAAIQKHGDDKYGVDNWRGISVLDHLNHAQIHYLAFMAGDTQDKHLEHYATRVLMALELHLEQNGVTADDQAEA